MTDRLMALLVFVAVAGFLGVLIAKVPRLDLALILGATMLLLFYDFFLSPTRAGRKPPGPRP
jgi:uncharacterized membrane protein YfcA